MIGGIDPELSWVIANEFWRVILEDSRMQRQKSTLGLRSNALRDLSPDGEECDCHGEADKCPRHAP